MREYYDRRAPEYDDWYLGRRGAALAAELGGGEVLYEGRWFVLVRATL